MHIVIDISKNVYEFACRYPDALLSVYAHAIKNGTPLSKGHGRLIDAERYRKEMFESREFDFFKILDMQQTIIEADKVESGKEGDNNDT